MNVHDELLDGDLAHRKMEAIAVPHLPATHDEVLGQVRDAVDLAVPALQQADLRQEPIIKREAGHPGAPASLSPIGPERPPGSASPEARAGPCQARSGCSRSGPGSSRSRPERRAPRSADARAGPQRGSPRRDASPCARGRSGHTTPAGHRWRARPGRGRPELFHEQRAQAEATLNASRDVQVRAAWALIQEFGRGLPQEEFVRGA